MVKMGAEYYPKRTEIIDIVRQSLKNVKFDTDVKLNVDEPYKLFRNYKRGIVGINNFIVNSNLSEDVKARLDQIRNGELDRKKMLYNPVEIYHLANEINYQMRVRNGQYVSQHNFIILKNIMEDLVRKGVNLEEVKKNILLDNLIAFNNRTDTYVSNVFNEHLMDNAIDTIEVIERFDNLSPYFAVFKIYNDAMLEKNPEIYKIKNERAKAEIAKYDPNMLKMYAIDKIMSDILSCLVELREVKFPDSYLDKISKVEKVEDQITNGKPVVRRCYFEGFIKDIFDLATMRREIKYSELLNLFHNLVLTLAKYHKNVNVAEVKDEFVAALVLFSYLSQENASGSSNANNVDDLER